MLDLRRAAVFCLLACSASAEQLNFILDPAKTQINWTLPGNVHTVHGTFRLQEGQLSVDSLTGAISGDITARADSGNSSNSARDKRMHKEVLESERYPEIRFTPEKLEGAIHPAGHSAIQVTGVFLIHGASHSVTIPMDVAVSDTELIGTGKFSIPYVDWGMKDPSNFLFKVDKSVELQIVARARTTRK